MLTVISFIVVLGVLIFIHELGHFAVAKLSGVGVEKFSLGFGPKLVGVKKGETEYLLSLLPLGGYVKMVGEAPGEEVVDRDRSRSYAAKRVGVRAAIVAAGPVMNLVLAAVLLPVIFLIGVQTPAYLDKPAEIGYVVPGAAASKAGIMKGDVITRVDGSDVRTWEALFTSVALSPGKAVDVEYERAGTKGTAVMTPETSRENGGGMAGLLPPMRPLIGDVADGYPAKEAGLRAGDLIIAINGEPITHWAELEGHIHANGGVKEFLIERDGARFSASITPLFNKEMNVFLVGVSRKDDTVLKRYGLFSAIGKGVASGFDMTWRLFTVVKGLVTGQYSIKTLGGPIMIAQVAGKAAASGVVDLLLLVAFLSLQLGIINLFPIPVLDGGHIVFLAIERIKGSPISEKIMGTAQQIGVALLIGLMLLVTYNDIFRIFG